MHISEQATDGALVVSASGRLDIGTSDAFKTALMAKVDAGHNALAALSAKAA